MSQTELLIRELQSLPQYYIKTTLDFIKYLNYLGRNKTENTVPAAGWKNNPWDTHLADNGDGSEEWYEDDPWNPAFQANCRKVAEEAARMEENG